MVIYQDGTGQMLSVNSKREASFAVSEMLVEEGR